MKNSLMQAIVIAAVATAPVVSFAQANAPVTRAEVKRELAQFEGSGYSLAGSNVDYPTQLQAAKTRAGNKTAGAITTAYGGSIAGATEVGSRRLSSVAAKSLYLENTNSLYVGD